MAAYIELRLINILPGSLPDGYNGIFLSSNALGVGTKGGSVSIDVCSSVNWTASTDQSWLSLSTNTGISGKINLSLTASEIQIGSDRSAKVTISAAGFASQTITINQYTKKIITPGGLQSLIAQNTSTISNLTLSGSIDARDFKTMRDAMPKLTDINLEDVTIVAYTGSEGTNSGNYVYNANTIPPLAFNIIPCKGQSPVKSIVLPATTRSIEFLAFAECKYLTAINIPELVDNINSFAFHLCNASINAEAKNPYYSSINGILYNKSKSTILHFPFYRTGSYTIPSTVISIGERAFDSCNKMTDLTIPSSVNSIEYEAFIGCSGVTTIFVPRSITSIGSEAFHNCSALINVDSNNLNYSSIEGVLFNKTQTKLIQCPNSMKGIYTIPPSVTSIGGYAFANCSGLTNVIIPSLVKTIEMNAFQYCGGLNEFKIPSTVSSIEYGILSFCNGLRSITIPSSVVSISSSAFSGCRKLGSISVYLNSPINLNSSWGVFYDVNKYTCTLYVPYGSKAAYQVAAQWQDFSNIVEMPNQAPIANSGLDQTITAHKLVILNGSSSSDAEGNSLTYKWTDPSGITLNSTTVAMPTFTAPNVTTTTNFTFSLIVNDGVLDSPADQVEITVTPNKAPTANAGTDQTVNENSLCTLDGSASSDPDKDALTYLWIAPSGITLSPNTTPKPTFTAPEVTTDTNYTFSLVVKDGSLNSTADQIAVTVKHINKTPTANAGNDQIVNENSLCTLDGSSSSDPDNDALTYLWTAPAGITLSSNTASKPTFTAPEISIDTKYTFSLVVNDGFLNSTADPVIITVKNVDKAPYLKNPISNISVDKRAPDQIIDLKTVFADDDFADVLSYSITSNSNNQVVSTKITGSNLTLSFSSLNIGLTEIVITANSNGKVVITKFNVEVKIPTETNPLVRNQKLTVFPNPTNGKIEIVFDQIPRGGTELIVTDIIGRTILKQIIQENEEWIDITGYSPGIYLFKTNLDDSTVQKVILK